MKKIFLLFISISLFIFQAQAQEVALNAKEIQPLLIGENIPKVTLQNAKFENISLTEMVQKKPTILIFYRGGWCPYCNRQLASLGQVSADLVEMGFQILAISPDRPENLQAMIEEHKVTYTLLSDSKMEAARKFGVAFQVDDNTIAKYKRYNIDLEDASGENHNQLPVPSVFFVNQKGEIKFEYINPDYTVRVKEDLLLDVAKSMLKEN